MGHTIKKEFRFEAAHRLVRGYKGNCAHLHGHSWQVSIEMKGELNHLGMVMDFADVRPLREWVDQFLDHATIVSTEDDVLVAFLTETKQRLFLVGHNPTSENLTKILFDKAREYGLPVSAVEIKETCTSTARYECDE